MGRGDWSERQPRPKVQRLSPEQKEKILATLVEGIKASPVLSALGIRARTLRGRFYLERLWEEPGEDLEIEVIGRITPLTKPKTETGKACTVQEALYHFFEIPIPVISEPAQWIRYRRKPEYRVCRGMA